MNTCIGALYFLLLSSTHSTKLLPRVVRANTSPSTAISARARPRSLTLGWGRVWGVVAEPFSGKTPKKGPPLWELLRVFSSETSRGGEEKLFLPVAATEERPKASQSVSTLMLSIPERPTIPVTSPVLLLQPKKNLINELILVPCTKIDIRRQTKWRVTRL